MPTEQDLRLDPTACHRVVARFGWDDLVFAHIPARVPGDEHRFLPGTSGGGV